MHRLLALSAAVIAVAILCGCGGAASAPTMLSPEQAITGFDPTAGHLEDSFANLNQAAHDDPDGVRTAAVAHLGDAKPELHYAAVYGLALTASPGKGSTELAGLLAATNADDRLLAAGALTGVGDKRGLPVLIAALSQSDTLLYRDPPEAGFEFARRMLLRFTKHDFGLSATSTPTGLTASQPAWDAWWKTNQAAIHFDAGTQRFLP